MVNKTIINKLFSDSLESCENVSFCVDVPNSKLDEYLILLRLSKASWEITSVYGCDLDEYTSLCITL